METKARSLLKATLWTLLGWLCMTAVGWVFTGSVAIGGSMALVNAAIGFASYVVYERVWAGISWGRSHGR